MSLSRKMSKVGLLAAMKTFTKPHFQRKKKRQEGGVKQQSRSWDSGLCHLGVSPPGPGTATLGTVGSYKRIYWPGQLTGTVSVKQKFLKVVKEFGGFASHKGQNQLKIYWPGHLTCTVLPFI